MPHIHLLTSSDLVENVDVPDILASLVEELSAQESVDPASVKAYHSLHHTWAMGAGAQHGFVHCSVSLLRGRTPDLRRRIAEAMYARLRECFGSTVESGEASVTLELREMDSETYMK
jgi:5-carboxymethyl-2-hydroxymuconate isomerase